MVFDTNLGRCLEYPAMAQIIGCVPPEFCAGAVQTIVKEKETMKFGMFYEIQVPRPAAPEAEHERIREIVD